MPGTVAARKVTGDEIGVHFVVLARFRSEKSCSWLTGDVGVGSCCRLSDDGLWWIVQSDFLMKELKELSAMVDLLAGVRMDGKTSLVAFLRVAK